MFVRNPPLNQIYCRFVRIIFVVVWRNCDCELVKISLEMKCLLSFE
jgi:hypothetical protein